MFAQFQYILFTPWKVFYHLFPFYSFYLFDKSIIHRITHPTIPLQYQLTVMISKFRPSKSLSSVDDALHSNKRLQPLEADNNYQHSNAKQVLEQYGKTPQLFQEISKKSKKRKIENNETKKALLKRQNIYCASTTCGESQQEIKQIKTSKGKTQMQGKSLSLIKNHLRQLQRADSLESSISSIRLSKHNRNDFEQKDQQSKQKEEIRFKKVNLKCIDKNKLSMKNISTKTSIKQIQQNQQNITFKLIQHQYNSKEPLTEQPSPCSIESIKPNDKLDRRLNSYQTAMRGLIKQVRSLRQQKNSMCNQLIRIKSHQFFYLERERVKQLVLTLQKEKQISKQANIQIRLIKEANQKQKESRLRAQKQMVKLRREYNELKKKYELLRNDY